MGYYVETNGAHGKAKAIQEQHGAEEVTMNEAEDALAEGKGVVCVVSNGHFEAAAFIYNKHEFEEFAWPGDMRPKTWLVMDRELAEKLSGYKGH